MKEREARNWKVKEPQVRVGKRQSGCQERREYLPVAVLSHSLFSLTHGCVTLGSLVMSLSSVLSYLIG